MRPKILLFMLLRLLRNLAIVLVICEFVIYYIVLYQCNWHSSKNGGDLRVMLLADTHMLGPFKGHWFDKLRREWQMHRAFQTAITLFNPEIVFMLGDIFDEGNWVNSSQFDDYHARFNRLFYVPETTRLYAVVGNHDVGFHYATYPYLIDRFDRAFNTSVVELITEKNIHFVTINSMAMEQDNCSLCKEAEKALKVISNQLNCYKGTGKNCKNVKQKSYSQPIVLQHFPTYRESDERCIEKDSDKQDVYREGWEVISKESTDLIGRMLSPRLILSGHSHFYCRIRNTLKIEEYTLASFNWRNLNHPSFVLANFTPKNYAVSKCEMPKESTVLYMYVVLGLLSVLDSIFSIKQLVTKAYFTMYKRLKPPAKERIN